MTQLQLDTPYGPIYVTPQDDCKLYVQAGRGAAIEGHRYGDPDPPDLDVGNARIYVNGHLSRNPETGEWEVQKPYTSIKRTDNQHEPTPTMWNKVAAALLMAARQVPEEELEKARWAKAHDLAVGRAKTVAELRRLADALEREAVELDRGGREEYHEHRTGGGLRDTLRHVRTVEGELLPSLPEVKVYQTDRYGPRLP